MNEFFFLTLDNLFRKCSVSPLEIDILVLNVSMLASVPSLSSRIINHYKMREDVKVFNLSGMGCSARISIDLVQNVFKSISNAFAIVLTSESIAPNWYTGNEKSMVLSNCLFRSRGCSILLTNKKSLKHQAILKLKCLVRTHLGSLDNAYNSCIQKEDDQRRLGFHLGKHIPSAAIQAENLRRLAPKIFSVTELFTYIMSRILKQTLNINIKTMNLNFKSRVQHFCLHPGGTAVIEGLRKGMGLSEADVEPSRMTLHRFGNTSASSVWYVLGYIEAKKMLKKSDIIMMLSLGAGFKCNTCLWEVVRDSEDINVWGNRTEEYPLTTIENPYLQKFGWIYDLDN